MPVKLNLTFSVRGYELDSYGHVNNAVYLNYFEHARWEYFRELDLYPVLQQLNISPVVTDIHIRYQREVKLFDQLRIESVCHQDGPYLVFQQRLFNDSAGLQAARATTKLIFIDAGHIPQDIPEELLKRTKNTEA